MYRDQEIIPPPPPEVSGKTNTMSLISLITGIISVLTGILSLCAWCLGGIPLLFGIAGAVTGYLAKKQIDESGGPQSSRKMASAGMILGLVGIGLSLIFIVLGIIYSGFIALSDFI